jgi:hypothetical protein
MFPISGFFTVTPMPELIVTPSIWGQVGLNTMYFSQKTSDAAADTSVSAEDGWYMGVIWKIAADALVRIGESSSFFAGFEYQWSKPKKLDIRKDDIFVRRDMSGVGLRMGFRVIY